MEIVGWVSGVLLAFCAIPQLIQAVRQGHCDDLSGTFILMWFFGLVGSMAYAISTGTLTTPLAVNFTVNTVISAVLIIYKYKTSSVIGALLAVMLAPLSLLYIICLYTYLIYRRITKKDRYVS